VILDVYENDIRRIRTQQHVAVETEAYPGETFSGRVTFIDPVVNPESRTIRVRTELPNASGRLRPNMFVRGTIAEDPGMALSVPTSALLLTGKRAVVWVETGPNVFVPRTVVAGALSGEYTEIISGLRAGEMVAATGGFLLDSESRLSQPNAPDEHAAHK
jgi:Cu(I)/Ag(I) efflux system membrane fusion protein